MRNFFFHACYYLIRTSGILKLQKAEAHYTKVLNILGFFIYLAHRGEFTAQIIFPKVFKRKL